MVVSMGGLSSTCISSALHYLLCGQSSQQKERLGLDTCRNWSCIPYSELDDSEFRTGVGCVTPLQVHFWIEHMCRVRKTGMLFTKRSIDIFCHSLCILAPGLERNFLFSNLFWGDSAWSLRSSSSPAK